MSEEIAFYMFGYYAIKCWKSDNFWRIDEDSVIERNSIYWSRFRNFAEQMEQMERRLVSGHIVPKKMKF
jgi:hypothetical protein